MDVSSILTSAPFLLTNTPEQARREPNCRESQVVYVLLLHLDAVVLETSELRADHAVVLQLERAAQSLLPMTLTPVEYVTIAVLSLFCHHFSLCVSAEQE